MTLSEEKDLLLRALNLDSAASSDFDLNPETVLAKNHALRAAGVLFPLRPSDAGLQVILTKRSSALKHHPGQICFPGGKVEEADRDVTAAALREAHEEIGLLPEQVEILGALPGHETVTGFTMSPIIGLVDAKFAPNPDPGEVAEVFEVPLSHVCDPDRFTVQSRRWRGQRRYYYTVPWGPYYIWGATARILRGLADRMYR